MRVSFHLNSPRSHSTIAVPDRHEEFSRDRRQFPAAGCIFKNSTPFANMLFFQNFRIYNVTKYYRFVALSSRVFRSMTRQDVRNTAENVYKYVVLAFRVGPPLQRILGSAIMRGARGAGVVIRRPGGGRSGSCHNEQEGFSRWLSGDGSYAYLWTATSRGTSPPTGGVVSVRYHLCRVWWERYEG
jgi:hypothetical protein